LTIPASAAGKDLVAEIAAARAVVGHRDGLATQRETFTFPFTYTVPVGKVAAAPVDKPIDKPTTRPTTRPTVVPPTKVPVDPPSTKPTDGPSSSGPPSSGPTKPGAAPPLGGGSKVTTVVPKQALKRVGVLKVKKLKSGKVRVVLKVKGVKKPTGKIRVKFGKVSKTYKLKAKHKGKRTITVPAKAWKKAKGKTLKIKATYLGNSTIAATTAKAVKVRVMR
jgi:hypothetical protein